MKRWMSLLLAAAMLSLFPAAAAEERAVTPVPPMWVAEGDYLRFPGDPVYQPEAWGEIEALRTAARAGASLPAEGRDWASGSPGKCYETGLLRLQYAANAAGDPDAQGEALLSAGKAFSAAESGWIDQNRSKDALAHRLAVEKYRAYLAYHPAYVADWGRGIVPALDALGMSLEEFFNTPFLASRLSPEERAAVEKSVYDFWSFYLEQRNLISVYVDGGVLLMDTLPQVRDQRTMVPIRAVAEALGADVEWRQESNQVAMTRAGSTVVMALGSTVAMVDGKPVKMDVAPYADQNRTYLPVRWVSEFFGQVVEWDQDQRRVDIREDKSAWEGSNVEAWAKPMGALLSFTAGGDPAIFGGWCRAPHPNGLRSSLVEPAALSRETLRENWDITGRESLLTELEDALAGGHTRMFLEVAQKVKDSSRADVKQMTVRLDDMEQYMWYQTWQLWQKWKGDPGLLAWDLCRAANLAQWGYTAGYLTYDEAMTACEKAAKQLGRTFSSWDEVYENYTDGYYWCVRADMTETDPWDSEFGMAYLALRSTLGVAPIFDNSLFSAGVVSPAAKAGK